MTLHCFNLYLFLIQTSFTHEADAKLNHWGYGLQLLSIVGLSELEYYYITIQNFDKGLTIAKPR